MKVVSNSSPLIGLARINQLTLLERLYTEIYVPTAVWNEVVVQGRNQPGAVAVGQAQWIRQAAVQNSTLVLSLSHELGEGEAEAIALAQELTADLLIVDERHARERARRLGIRFVGVCGVLVEAKARGLLSAIKPALKQLQSIAGFDLSAALQENVLRQVGES